MTLQKVVVWPIQPFAGIIADNDDVARSNPLCKLPTLILDEADPTTALYDSRVICEYLEHLSGSAEGKGGESESKEHFTQQTIIAAAMGIMDAEVLCVYEDRIRKPLGISYEPWVDGMRVKVNKGLDALEEWIVKGDLKVKSQEDRVETIDIAVGVTCWMMEARGLNWRQGRDGLKDYIEKTWEGRRSWVETPADKEWDKIGVEGKL